MIALKDIPVLVSLSGAILTGGFYVHDIKRDVAELSVDYRQHVTTQQKKDLYEQKWQLQDRLKENPADNETRRRLEETEQLIQENQLMQQQLKGGK